MDICSNRHGGNPQSVEAFNSTPESVRKNLREQIYEYAVQSGDRGITCDEVVVNLDIIHPTASARMSELRKEGRLVENGQTRLTRRGKSAAVLIANPVT